MGKQSRQALSERADIASQGRENTSKAGTKTLSPKYCWVFCRQRKYPSFRSLKKMETEAYASTHRGYQEPKLCDKILRRKLLMQKITSWMLFCHPAVRPVTSWVLADQQSCNLIPVTLISSWYVTTRREFQHCRSSGLAIKKFITRWCILVWTFEQLAEKYPIFQENCHPDSWVNLRWAINLIYLKNVSLVF